MNERLTPLVTRASRHRSKGITSSSKKLLVARGALVVPVRFGAERNISACGRLRVWMNWTLFFGGILFKEGPEILPFIQ